MKYIIFFLLPFTIFSQEITGKVYDSETTVKGIDVYNISQKTIAYTNDNGNFTISAAVGDTLSFHSTFHNPKIIKLTKDDFENTLIVELVKTINRLNEILLQNNIDPADFNEKKQEQSITETITEDSKVNPHLYGTSSEYGLDVIRLAGLVGKLIKGNKTKKKSIELMNAKSLDSLFKNDNFFNKSLLVRDLKIPESQQQLFFDYCESQKLDKELVAKENKLLLLEELVLLSEEHKKILESASKN
ncbi:hypothetical protein [uncultured Algibacter sp.]|uniref:hypothetical protein n=1 Tax=uncultured Algibacter sp. TaxID=298659 RepID=UPI00260C1BFC|nr:hypothetical protein [uncultured Algibacter sp.]